MEATSDCDSNSNSVPDDASLIPAKNIEQQKEICKFYLEGKCRFKDNCLNLHVGEVEQIINKKNPKKDKSVKPKEMEEELNTKKPSMRTAGDVRKRIQWDPSLKLEDFSIGYLDRFDGVIEKPFSAFTWEHLADAEIDDLAIPQHRIQYFKYKTRTVWDKSLRLDHVFGSSGNEKTITEVMEEVDGEEEAAAGNEQVPSDEEDSDDDIVVCVPSGDCTSVIAEVKEKVEQINKLRATHFLCLRINNDNLSKEVCKVQEHIISCEPILRSCAMPSEILHVTLAMVKCDTDASIDAVSNCLTDIKEIIPQLKSYNKKGNIITAKSLSTFGARVLYSNLQIPELFTEVIKYLHENLRKIEGVTITNHFNFVPHMTLLKINRFIARERKSKYLDSGLYNKYFEHFFGEINFNNIYFCVINDYRGNDRFYLTSNKIEF